jgi:hypothetical protein
VEWGGRGFDSSSPGGASGVDAIIDSNVEAMLVAGRSNFFSSDGHVLIFFSYFCKISSTCTCLSSNC